MVWVTVSIVLVISEDPPDPSSSLASTIAPPLAGAIVARVSSEDPWPFSRGK
jgi:hypothetical protein